MLHHSLRSVRRGSLTVRAAAFAILALLISAPVASAVVEETGYFAARDGTKLRYSVERPDGPGPFPVLINYEGYAAGSNARDNGVMTVVAMTAGDLRDLAASIPQLDERLRSAADARHPINQCA